MDLGQVFTKNVVADFMVSQFNISKDSLVLDPCFGGGAFLNSLQHNGFNNFQGYEIDEVLFSNVKEKWTEKKLYKEDFLLNDNVEKFDGIIMNPPYIRQEKIDDLKYFGINKKILSKIAVYKDLSSKSNIYMYFILKAISMLKNDGEMVVIFPKSWTASNTGQKFKELLFEKCSLISQTYLYGELFEKKALVDVFVLHLKKGRTGTNSITNSYCLIDNEFIPNDEHKVEKNLGFEVEFNSIATIRRGLTTGFNSMYINPPFHEKESQKHVRKILSSPKSVNGYNTKGAKLDDIFLPDTSIGFSHEIQEFLKEKRNGILATEKPKTLLKEIKSENPNWFSISSFDSKGIIFNYFVRNNMKFIMNDFELVRDNFYIIKSKINKYLLFSLLNNFYSYYQLEIYGKRYGAGLLKLQKYDLENLVFPNYNNFSVEDTDKLIEYGRKLSNENSVECIRQTTKIIAKYSKVNFAEIEEEYETVKKNRLKGEK